MGLPAGCSVVHQLLVKPQKSMRLWAGLRSHTMMVKHSYRLRMQGNDTQGGRLWKFVYICSNSTLEVCEVVMKEEATCATEA